MRILNEKVLTWNISPDVFIIFEDFWKFGFCWLKEKINPSREYPNFFCWFALELSRKNLLVCSPPVMQDFHKIPNKIFGRGLGIELNL